MRILIALVMLASLPALAVDVICTGGDDTEQINSAIQLHSKINLSGACVTSYPILVGSEKLITGPARINSAASPAILITGHDVTFRDLIITGAGDGVLLDGAVKVRLESVQINTLSGTGVHAANGAGLWLSNAHFNGAQGYRSIGVRFGNWDSAWLRDVLIEEHDTGVRFGTGTGTTANIFLNGVVVDRAIVAFIVEPDGNASAQNIIVSNSWGAGSANGLVPISVSGGSTTGYVGSIIFDACYFSGFKYGEIWTYQLDGQLLQENLIFK